MKQNDGAERKMKQGKRGKRRGLLIFTLIGLILILLFTGLIIHMFRARQAEKAEMEEVEAAENLPAQDIVIGLKGPAVQMVLQGEPYIENGAFAVDRNSGALQEGDIEVSGDVDTSKTGEYSVEYTAGSGDYAKTAVRTVKVLSEEDFGDKASNIPVMMYHWVYTEEDSPDDLDGNWILDTTLDEQLTFLEEEKFYYPGWKELRAWLDDKISLPAKCTILTFDDGREEFLKYGVPLLEKHKIPATSFMICWDNNGAEIKIPEYASPYLDFESHTYEMHQKSDDPEHKGIDAVMTKEEIAADLKKAADMIGNNDAIAYPYGDYTDDFIEAVREQGILCGFTVEYDRVRKGMDPLKLPRIRVLGDESFQIWKESIW